MTRTTILAAVVIFITQCQKDDTPYDFYFYTSMDTTDTQLTLYIDGDNKGLLINPPIVPDCASPDSILSALIYLQLTRGKYKIEAKDDKGVTRSSGIIKIRRNGIGSRSVFGATGGMSIIGRNNCMITDIFETRP